MFYKLKFRILEQYGSQSEFARICGKTETWISRLICGRQKPTEADLALIAEKLGTSHLADGFFASAATKRSQLGPYKHVKSVTTAIKILRFLSEEEGPVSGREVSKSVGIPLGTCMRQLSTLEAAEVVAQPLKGLYELGPSAASLWERKRALLEAEIVDITKEIEELEGRRNE